MREERLQILRLVAEGKVSPEDADDLLDALETETGFPPPPASPPRRPRFGPFPTANHLRIVIRSEDGDELNVAWPVEMLQGVGQMLPGWARQVVQTCGFDLAALAQAGFGATTVPGELFSVRSEDGDQVRISLEA